MHIGVRKNNLVWNCSIIKKIIIFEWKNDLQIVQSTTIYLFLMYLENIDLNELVIDKNFEIHRKLKVEVDLKNKF